MIDVPVPKCPYCGEPVQHLGHPKNRRFYCLGCKAQADGGEWFTWKEWEVRTNCGCCRHRPEDCEGCKDFDKWKDDNMEGEPLPEGWLPPFWRKEFRCKLPDTDERYWSGWLPMSKYEADPDCDYEFR